MNLHPKQLDFIRRWGTERKNKFEYLLVYGILNWALPFSVIMTLFDLYDRGFVVTDNVYPEFGLKYLLTLILGAIKASFSFHFRKKIYLNLENKGYEAA